MMPNHTLARRHLFAVLLTLTACPLLNQTTRAATAPTQDKLGITWETQTLANGLRVVYVPMTSSPVTHIRIFYHVGSRDERPDRQGFAHMFEHMMFRGSAHVAPQEHMKLIMQVGGYSNAETSFDYTDYQDTLPASYANMALWLEADRMSSFKVSADIFKTERDVVSEEWRKDENEPYGSMWWQLFAEEFKRGPYEWTPIGNMDQLHEAQPAELQAFFNTYYVPNNAVMVIAGPIDIAATKAEVAQYFGWIPKGKPIERHFLMDPPQTEARRAEVTMRVPLPRVVLGYHAPLITSDDTDPLDVMLTILGEGQSSRLNRALVTDANPLCVETSSLNEQLESGGIIGAEATVSQGKDPAAVEKILRQQIAAMRDTAVSPEELEKAKQQIRLYLATRFETVSQVGAELGENMIYYGNLDRVKTARARIEAVTPADVQRVARQYFGEDQSSLLLIKPGVPTPQEQATEPFAATTAPAAARAQGKPVATAAPKVIDFPADYPTSPPMTGNIPAATFQKGVEKDIDGVKVIVMEDHRIPMVSWSLTLRMGSNAIPPGKEGLAGVAADMVRRGPVGKTFDQFNEELESRGISLDVTDGGDNTSISGSCLTEQVAAGLAQTRDMILHPAFAPAEFTKVKDQDIDGLRLSLDDADTIASRKITKILYGDSPLGRLPTIDSLNGITLDDVKNYYHEIYHTQGAILMIAGDISVADGQADAKTLLAGLPGGAEPTVDYTLPAPPETRQIILVDRPQAKQSAIQMGIRAYTLQNQQKFAGSLTSQILSAGIDSRLGRYVRAEKGYVYGVEGYFSPSRHAGAFLADTGTRFETTGPTIEAMLTVFDQMKAAPVSKKELADAKLRVAGGMLMSMQTISEQAQQRVIGILNGYPIDYYDKYAERIGQVTAADVQSVLQQYVIDDKLNIIVVAPAKAVEAQLEKLGPVKVVPMPDGKADK